MSGYFSNYLPSSWDPIILAAARQVAETTRTDWQVQPEPTLRERLQQQHDANVAGLKQRLG